MVGNIKLKEAFVLLLKIFLDFSTGGSPVKVYIIIILKTKSKKRKSNLVYIIHLESNIL